MRDFLSIFAIRKSLKLIDNDFDLDMITRILTASKNQGLMLHQTLGGGELKPGFFASGTTPKAITSAALVRLF